MSECVIRGAEPRDAEDLRDIYASPEVYSSTMQLPYPSLSFWQEKLKPLPLGNTWLVAELNGKVVGDLLLSRSPSLRRQHVLAVGMGGIRAASARALGRNCCLPPSSKASTG